MMAMASGHKETTDEFYHDVVLYTPRIDRLPTNKGLAAEIYGKLGIEWIPGQIYCCIHTVLGWQDGMVKKWCEYQEKIGYDKLYPNQGLK